MLYFNTHRDAANKFTREFPAEPQLQLQEISRLDFPPSGFVSQTPSLWLWMLQICGIGDAGLRTGLLGTQPFRLMRAAPLIPRVFLSLALIMPDDLNHTCSHRNVVIATVCMNCAERS